MVDLIMAFGHMISQGSGAGPAEIILGLVFIGIAIRLCLFY